MDTRRGWILATAAVLLSLADPSLGSFKCHSCIEDSNIPRKCTRDEYQGVFIKCPVDNSPVNTCYKSVHRVTGEVSRGCAPDNRNKNSVYKSPEGPWGEYGVDTFYCNTQLCNDSVKIIPGLASLIISTLLVLRV